MKRTEIQDFDSAWFDLFEYHHVLQLLNVGEIYVEDPTHPSFNHEHTDLVRKYWGLECDN